MHESVGTEYASAFSENDLKFIDRSVLMNFHQKNREPNISVGLRSLS